MKKQIAVPASAIGLAFLIGSAAISKSELSEEDSDITVTMDQVPDQIRSVILKEAKDHEIVEVEQVLDGAGNVVYYEAEWIDGSTEYEVTVELTGKIVSRESEPVDAEDDDLEDDRKRS